MKKLTLLFAAISLSVAMSGCGKNEAVKDMEDLADRVCACKDATCAGDEAKKAVELMTKHKDTKGTEADMKAITAAGEKIQGCMQKLAKP
jgi:hypothetical protein